MSFSMKQLTSIGTILGSAALAIGGGAVLFGQFKKEENAEFRHLKIPKPPMYLFDDALSVQSSSAAAIEIKSEVIHSRLRVLVNQ